LQKIFEGNRGEIYLIDYYGRPAVLKKLRPGKRNTLTNEAKILRYLEPLKIAPKLYEAGEAYLIMEYIEGKSLKEALQQSRKSALLAALEAAYILDRAGVYHRQLGRYYHFILTPQRMRVVDFERATMSAHPRNVLQFVGYYLRDLPLQDAVQLYKRHRQAGYHKIVEAIRDVL